MIPKSSPSCLNQGFDNTLGLLNQYLSIEQNPLAYSVLSIQPRTLVASTLYVLAPRSQPTSSSIWYCVKGFTILQILHLTATAYNTPGWHYFSPHNEDFPKKYKRDVGNGDHGVLDFTLHSHWTQKYLYPNTINHLSVQSIILLAHSVYNNLLHLTFSHTRSSNLPSPPCRQIM